MPRRCNALAGENEGEVKVTRGSASAMSSCLLGTLSAGEPARNDRSLVVRERYASVRQGNHQPKTPRTERKSYDLRGCVVAISELRLGGA